MAEAVAGLLTSAFVKIAKDKLGSAIGEQANLLWNFGSDLEDMKDTLDTISAALEDAEGRSVKENVVRLLLKRLKQAALDISDILEDYQDTSDQATTAKMPRFLSCLPMGYKRIVVANRMKTARENLSKINKDFLSFNFIQGTTTTIVQCYDKRETTSDLPEEPIIGRDREKQKIIDLLLSADTNNDEIVIVPIYGLGGMGKSTVAQQVYNDDQIKKYDHRIWIYVSQDFNLLQIGRSIISQLPTDGGQPNSDTQQAINNFIGNLLHGKKVLIVLDDLWEDQQTELNKLRRMLHVKDSIMRVIITTRKEDIARKISTNEPYKLQLLNDDICWEIIKRPSNFDIKSNKEKLEEIGLDIAKKCGGVALAAQAIGFMLRSIDNESGWTEINNNDIWNEPCKDNDVLPSLKLSYERMPPQVRICFSYCAIFPKGHNIVKDDLVHQWIALGFIGRSKGMDCIKILLEMSFLQVSKLPTTSQEHVVRYTMHDLVHDLARLTMADELSVFDVAPKRNARDHKYRHYSLLRKYDGTTKLSNILPSKMRVLRFSDCGKLDIPSAAFSFAKCLRTLDFSETSGIFLPDSIGQLKQLRCLIAPKMQNESLPEFITELAKLQYLNINESSQISALPESIYKLGCLEYLGLSGCSGMSKLPESFGDIKCMVHLDMSGCTGISALPGSFGKLANLQHLELSDCSSLQKLPESLCGITQLQHLNLSSCNCLQRLPEAIGNLADLQYLNMSRCQEIKKLPESMMKLQNLLHLELSQCGGVKEWSLLGGLRGLTSLKKLILACCAIDAVDFIGTLTNLEHLDLSFNTQLLCLPKSICNLKRLQTLNLHWCRRLESLPDNIGTLGLKSLLLEGCLSELMDQASSLVHYSRTLPVFKVLADDVSSCRKLHLLEGAHHISELRILSLENARFLEKASQAKLADKHNLSKLELNWTTGVDRHLKDIDLLEQLVPPRALEHLSLKGYSCTGFPGWVMDISRYLTNLISGCSMEVFHHFSALQVLRISYCENLTSLPESMRHLTSLQLLTLETCDGIAALPEWLGDLSSLKTFVIDRCWSIKSLPSCIHQLKELEKLEIRQNRELKEWCESEENKMKLAHINVIKFEDCD
ncbi:hypothetical protein U9M48_001443 [Paspalum notatum var. saurae]|uniref:Uncharacterized protein n=1 Tax=Paspalum notatum var. saurae TaxID=547442 RepID=A0AAQ3SGP7_PASNO